MAGLAFGTAIRRISSLEVQVYLQVLLHQPQAVQMLLAPENLLRENQRGSDSHNRRVWNEEQEKKDSNSKNLKQRD